MCHRSVNRLELEARLLAKALPSLSDNHEFDLLCRNLANELVTRITIVGADGRVLCDSAEASATMEITVGGQKSSRP